LAHAVSHPFAAKVREVSQLHVTRPSDRPDSNHLNHFRHRFLTLPLSAPDLPAYAGLDFASFHAGSSMVPAETSSLSFGPVFTSRCSPHPLTAMQLRLVTGRRAFARRGLPPLCTCALVGARGAGPWPAPHFSRATG